MFLPLRSIYILKKKHVKVKDVLVQKPGNASWVISNMAVPSTSRFFSWGSCCHERIWNNYIEINWKSMQVRFIMLLCTQRYTSLADLTRQHEVWWTTHLNTLIKTDPTETWWREYSFRLNPLQCTYFLINWRNVQYKIYLMIWSPRKQYYLGVWAFSQLKLVYI